MEIINEQNSIKIDRAHPPNLCKSSFFSQRATKYKTLHASKFISIVQIKRDLYFLSDHSSCIYSFCLLLKILLDFYFILRNCILFTWLHLAWLHMLTARTVQFNEKNVFVSSLPCKQTLLNPSGNRDELLFRSLNVLHIIFLL